MGRGQAAGGRPLCTVAAMPWLSEFPCGPPRPGREGWRAAWAVGAMLWMSLAVAQPQEAWSRCGLPDFRLTLEQRVNAARAQPRMCGAQAMPAVPPLAWDARLFSAASGHALDMAVRNYFSHTGLDGRAVAQRVSAEGYGWRSVGENLAAGERTIDGVIAGWLSSPGHCSNLMSRDFAAFGVSCVQRAGSAYGHYWTMVLARP